MRRYGIPCGSRDRSMTPPHAVPGAGCEVNARFGNGGFAGRECWPLLAMDLSFSKPHSRCRRPACTGDPVFQRQLCLSREAAAYWVARSMCAIAHRPGDDIEDEDTALRSRDMICPSFASRFALFLQRAQGKPGADRTHGPRAIGRKLGGRTTGVTGNNPAFPARWVTAYTCSPR